MADGISIIEPSAPATRPRKANECITDVKQFRPPEALFDEFWREGEIALLFGAAGVGKSVLAVQIAEAVARGSGIGKFAMTARRQNSKRLSAPSTVSSRRNRRHATFC